MASKNLAMEKNLFFCQMHKESFGRSILKQLYLEQILAKETSKKFLENNKIKRNFCFFIIK